MISNWILPYLESDPIAVLTLLAAATGLAAGLLRYLHHRKMHEAFYRVIFAAVALLSFVEMVPYLAEKAMTPKTYSLPSAGTSEAIAYWFGVALFGAIGLGTSLLALSDDYIRRFARWTRTIDKDYRKSDYTWYEPIDY